MINNCQHDSILDNDKTLLDYIADDSMQLTIESNPLIGNHRSSKRYDLSMFKCLGSFWYLEPARLRCLGDSAAVVWEHDERSNRSHASGKCKH